MFAKSEWIILGAMLFIGASIIYALIAFTIFLNKAAKYIEVERRQTNILIKDHEIANAQHEARNNKQVELVKQLLIDHQQIMEKLSK